VADQVKAAASAARLAAVRENISRIAAEFRRTPDRTSGTVQQLLEQFIGNAAVPSDKIESLWQRALQRIAEVKARSGDFATILRLTDLIAKKEAPVWAQLAQTEPVSGTDAVVRPNWRDAWDHAAADAALAAMDSRERLSALAREREDADRRCRKLFAELVRERTFYELDRRLSPSVKAALVEFVRALARIGKGTGITAGQHRRTARDAMARCYDAVPCWIMPTRRVAEQLPADLGALDLVIIDEASQCGPTFVGQPGWNCRRRCDRRQGCYVFW
jgi:hypothetical protein